MANHLWSGRFEHAPDTDVFGFQASFSFDRRLFEDDIRGSLAWAGALADAGVMSSEEAKIVTDGLNDILNRGLTDPSFVTGDDEDVHSFVERQLVERVGDAGKRLHTGRSRNDQVSLDLRLYVRRQVHCLQSLTLELISALVDQANAAGSTLMPAYTHLRRAQPILVAHFFLAHIAALKRDHQRFDTVREEADAMPLGSGAIAGSGYAVDTERLASRLGFSRVVSNSVDAVSDRDFVSSFLHTCALLMVHLSRVAEDLVLFTSEEFAFFELADGVTTGSSLMPQKKNPDALELVRGKAGRTIGGLAGWLATMKGLPSGYNKDLQQDKEAVFDAEDTVSASLPAVTAVVHNLILSRKQTDSAASGLLLATDVADYLVSRGMPFRDAHSVVGRLVRQLLREGRDFESLSLEEWRAVNTLFGDDILKRVTARAAVKARLTPQSTNPEAVGAMLEECQEWLALARSRVTVEA